MKICLLALLLTTPFVARAAVYKCTLGGKTVYADRPCGADAERVHVSPNVTRMVERASPAPIPAPSSEQTKASNERETSASNCPTPYEMRQAIRHHHIKVCMTSQDVTRAQNVRYDDHQTKTAVYNGKQYVEWYYPAHLEGWPTIIRFQGGKVTGWE